MKSTKVQTLGTDRPTHKPSAVTLTVHVNRGLITRKEGHKVGKCIDQHTETTFYYIYIIVKEPCHACEHKSTRAMLTERYVAREASSRIMYIMPRCHYKLFQIPYIFTQGNPPHCTHLWFSTHAELCRLFHLREMIKGEGEDGGFSPWSQCQ